MALLLYMDHHIPRAVTDGARRRGLDVLTAGEDGRADEDDPNLLDRAGELGRVFVSQDSDLKADAEDRLRRGTSFIGLIYGAHLSGSVGRTIEDLMTICECCTLDDMRDHIEYLPL